MSINIKRISTGFVCLLWLGAFAGYAADRYVVLPGTPGGTNTGPYTDWTIAATQIQWAVDAAQLDEKVWVTNGDYRITNQITITNRITLQSVHGSSNTSVYADWPTYTTRCFYVTSTGTVDGFSISNGYLVGSNNYAGGGGAYVYQATIQNCYFTRNINSNLGTQAGGGGAFIGSAAIASNCTFVTNLSLSLGGAGLYVYFGQALKCIVISNYSRSHGSGIYTSSGFISNCFLSYNTTQAGLGGGAGINLNGGTVVDCVISNNRGSGGGGLLGNGTVRNCVIVKNYSTSSAGGISVNYGSTVSNCVISDNSCANGGGGITMGSTAGFDDEMINCRISNNLCSGSSGGGGLFLSSGRVRNCLIRNNTNLSASGYGGGVLMTNVTLNSNLFGLINCTIVNNYSTNEGGGLAVSGPSNYIANCVIAGNSSSSNNYPDVYNTGANSNNFWYSCANVPSAPLPPNQGNISNAPGFVDPSAGNYRLGANSPCIDTGTNQNWMTNSFDLDGNIRKRYGRVDMGAYEHINSGAIFGFH